MPDHSAIDTDAPPGINLTEIRKGAAVDDEDEVSARPFLGQNITILSVFVVIASILLVMFLSVSYLVASLETERKKKERGQLITDSLTVM